jgi:nicotinamide mononucleotide transporter
MDATIASVLEYAAVVLGVLCVWLTVRQNIWCWPVGLAMVTLYIVIFFEAKLYSDMLLQVIYVFLQLYGWQSWLHGGPQRSQLEISRVPIARAGLWSIVAVTGTGLLGGSMVRWTDASFPFLDAFTTVASLIAQWLMARKVLESWLVWILVDIVSIGIYWAKQLHLTAGLYVVFLVLASWGWREWQRQYRRLAAG